MRNVAVSKVLLMGATGTVIVLLVNIAVSMATDSTSLLRWLAAPIFGVAASAASAISQARHPIDEVISTQDRLLPRVEKKWSPRVLARRFGERLGKTSLTGGLVLSTVIIGCAGAGGAFAGQVGMAWLTGNESGSERLVTDTSHTTDGVTLTVVSVEHTAHFTRVTLRVDNETGGRLSLPVAEHNCMLIGGDGHVQPASLFRSDWTETLDDGQTRTGEITFTGHLNADVVRARLTFAHVYAEALDDLTTLTLTGIAVRPPN